MARTVTEVVLDHDGGRRVWASAPARPPEAIVHAADGATVTAWAEDLDAQPDLPPILVVSSAHPPDLDTRLREYSLGFDADLFAAHEQYFVGQLRDWVHRHYQIAPDRTRTAVYGASVSGELALAMGVRHPEVYGSVLCASPGAGFTPGEPWPAELPRICLVAGDDEPFFADNAARWHQALQAAGAQVRLIRRPGGHGEELWRAAFVPMMRWAFGSRSD